MKSFDISVKKFLSPFFNPGENLCIRVFSDRREEGFKGQKFDIDMEKIEQFLPVLREHNSKNRGIFFVVNYGGHEDSQITRINAQFVENDTLPVEEQYKRLMDFPLEPSIIVKTRKSLHSYWLIKGGDVKLFRTLQRRLAKHFEGDRSVVNESRVLRLPGFFHCKDEPIKVECIKYDPDLRYTQEELMKYLPVEEREQGAKPGPVSSKKGIKLVTCRCDFIKHCRENADKLPEYDWYAMITNLAQFEGGKEEIHKLSMPYPRYSRSETEDKIQHFLKSNTRPMNCRTIAERGYKCPKLEIGECSCKSPASLVYVPLDVDSLKLVLTEQPIEKNTTKDAARAAEFISEYMAGLDEVVAVAFITSEIKEHFNLKDANIRTLIKKYREVNSKYKEARKHRAENNGVLPEWYEVTENGIRFIPGILADHMSKNVHAFYGAEDFYIYEKGVYRAASEFEASKIIRDKLLDRCATMNGINDALGQWRILVWKPVNQLNPNPFIINLKNGLYDVLEEKLKPHTPDYCSTVQINANYNAMTRCDMFMKFLYDCLEEDEIYLVQEILGYLLVPINKAQKSFVFVGAGNAGKSTLLSAAQEILLGGDNVSNIPWQALTDRFKTAELFGKLANIFADLPSKSIDDNGLFKSITGEDYITAEKKNKTPFSFKPYARLLFSCNEIPRNYGDKSNAFYRRLIIIRFDKPVPMERRDVNLKEKLALEADGIFMWALEGLKRLIKNNYQFSESEKTRAEIEKYRVENNSVLSFVSCCCELDSSKYIETKELYNRYKQYCDEAGLNAVSQIRFNKELKENFEKLTSTKDTVSRRTVFQGIGLI